MSEETARAAKERARKAEFRLGADTALFMLSKHTDKAYILGLADSREQFGAPWFRGFVCHVRAWQAGVKDD